MPEPRDEPPFISKEAPPNREVGATGRTEPVRATPPTDEPPSDSAVDHPHALNCHCAKCECDRHPPFGIEPPSITFTVAEVDLLQGCVAGELARLLSHHDGEGEMHPQARLRYLHLVDLGNKLGMNL